MPTNEQADAQQPSDSGIASAEQTALGGGAIANAAQTALSPTHVNPDTHEQIAHDGQQWVNTQTGQPASVPMMTPDGTSVKMVPHDQADAYAVQEGMKPATKMMFPKGQKKWIPTDQVNDYKQQGGVLVGGAAVPRPQPPTLSPSETMPLAQEEDNSTANVNKTGAELGLPAAGGVLAAATGYGVAALAPAVSARVLAVVSQIPGIAHQAYTWAKAHPVEAYLAYQTAEQLGIGPKGLMKLLHLASGVEAGK